MYPVALVVHPNAHIRHVIVRGLRGAGFQVAGVDTFETAKHLLGLEPAAVLVTEARLGEHHGLHLVLLARSANPSVFAAVLAAEPDDVLQREVEGAGAVLFVGEQSESIALLISRRVAAAVPGPAWN
jgi:DNA-binding response OmpR family regulator